MIYVNELSKDFGKGNNQKTVLNRVSWTAPNGAVTGLLGRKESGKTAALRIITGIQSSSHGRVMIDSRDISTETVEARKNFGYVPDSTDQFLGLTGEEYLSFVADIYEVDAEKREAFLQEYRVRLGVELELKHRMYSYTKSIYKRVMLMGAMIHRPNNLILDNILENLDPGGLKTVKHVLKEYANKGNAVLLTADRLSAVTDLCSNIVYLAGGKVRFDGSFAGLIEEYRDLGALDLIDLKLSGELEIPKNGKSEDHRISLWGEKI